MFLTNRMRLFLSTAAVLSLVSAADEGYADQTSTMDITASVADACTFGAVGNLVFAAQYEPGQTTTEDTTTTFTVTCTVATNNVIVGLDKGGNDLASSGNRQMDNGAAGGRLEYILYKTDVNTPWGDSGDSHADPEQSFNFVLTNTVTVFGLLPGGQQPLGGAYSDTVNLKMSF